MTTQELDFVKQAKAISREQREKYLLAIAETKMHSYLVSLFTRAEDSTRAEITHGPDEYGRDIVLCRNDPYGQDYVGIVVKRNPNSKFTGKTSGSIDEIVSQARQAVTHECNLKEIFVGTVKISSVWIVVVGTLTRNAGRRLDQETKDIPGRRILTLDRLVDLFTEHYPEVFFAGGMSEYITDKIVELESWAGIASHTTRLSEWFVNPMVTVADGKMDSLEEGLPFAFANQKLPFGQLDQFIAEEARLVLTGDPGSGKSTALRKVAVNMLKKAQQRTIPLSGIKTPTSEKIQVPVVVNAVLAQGAKSIQDLIEDELPAPEIRESFRVGLILLDGLDEVVKDSSDTILRQTFEIADDYGCCLIISSRKVQSLQFDILDQGRSAIKVFDILPFELSQALELVKKATSNSDVMNILRDGLIRVQHQLHFTPLALELLIQIAEEEREIPGSISEIFDRYTDLALGRYDSQKGVQVVFDYFAKKRFLADLAWTEFKQKSRLEIKRSEFDDFVADYVVTFGWDVESFATLVGEIERSGLLRLGKTVFFAHRSFLEFFIALRAVENRQYENDYDQLLCDLYFDWMWSEVALYAVGQTRMASDRLVKRILAFGGDDFVGHLNKFMIGRLLQAGWHSASAVKKEAIRRGTSEGHMVFRHLSKMREDDAEHVPAVIPFFFLLMSGEYSYGSRTLFNETRTILDELTMDPSVTVFLQRLALLWAVRDRVNPETRDQLVGNALDHLVLLEKEKLFDLEDRMASLFYLGEMSSPSSETLKAVKRKARRLHRRNPEFTNRVFPSPKRTRRSKARTGE